uniref:Ig-like domain-containing protein n=1 Tax=Pelusios castaneus TaxID=367368 RepID=A0A8C8S6H4_9SAUR
LPCLSLSLSRSGCWAGPVTGPRWVRGPPGGSVAVPCRYQTGYEEYPKYWCRAGEVFWSCPEGHLAKTSEARMGVKWGRVSIWDNRPQRVFTVTVENLTPADAGKYYCGIQRAVSDLTHAVTVTVSPGKSQSCSQLAPAGRRFRPSRPVSGPYIQSLGSRPGPERPLLDPGQFW